MHNAFRVQPKEIDFRKIFYTMYKYEPVLNDSLTPKTENKLKLKYKFSKHCHRLLKNITIKNLP